MHKGSDEITFYWFPCEVKDNEASFRLLPKGTRIEKLSAKTLIRATARPINAMMKFTRKPIAITGAEINIPITKTFPIIEPS